MPATAKLSLKFYEKFGEEIANELVDWFNQVDTSYRTDLRELNEVNFARFDAKLEQRMAELRAQVEVRISDLDTRWDRRLGELEVRWGNRLSEFRTEFKTEVRELKAELIKWTFIFVTGGTITILCVLVTLLDR